MQATLRRDLSQLIVTVVIVIVCIGAIIRFQLPQVQQIANQSQNATAAEIQQQVAAEQVQLQLLHKIPAFGFDNLLADWVFLDFLQYFGDEPARLKTSYNLSPDFFQVILQHNPHFLPAYTFLSTSTAIYAGMPEKSIAIAEQALQSLQPNAPKGSYYAWRQLAIDQLLFLGDPQTARRSFQTAAEWATVQGNTQAANLSQQTADFLASNPNSRFAQISAWSMVLTTALDDRSRQRAVESIEALGGKVVPNPDGSVSIIPPEQD